MRHNPVNKNIRVQTDADTRVTSYESRVTNNQLPATIYYLPVRRPVIAELVSAFLHTTLQNQLAA